MSKTKKKSNKGQNKINSVDLVDGEGNKWVILLTKGKTPDGEQDIIVSVMCSKVPYIFRLGK